MFIGWLTCIPAVLRPHSLCRSTTANAPANRTFRATDTAKCRYNWSLAVIIKKKKDMKTRTFLTILLTLSSIFTFAQNDKTNREEYTLKLPVDGKQFYQQKIEKTPYFVKENVLQIYPGEKLFIEVETTKGQITSMKVVKENLNPQKTLIIDFTQTTKGKKSESMMLNIVNPFEKDIVYKAMMFIVGHDKWINTNVYPVRAKLTGIEMWSDVIITLVLSDWELKN